VPIAVTSDKKLESFFVRIDGVLFSMSSVERYLATFTRHEYDVAAVASCGDPRVRVIAVGRRLSCAIRGKGIPGQIEFKVANASGDLFVYNFPHMQPRDVSLIPSGSALYSVERR
jgi:hypothetical protein